MIAEDEALLVLELCDIVNELGYVVAGTAARLNTALHLAETLSFDLALLDMNLAGDRIDLVATRIQARGIPIIFVTGYGARTLPAGVSAPVLDKPVSVDELASVIKAVLRNRND